MKWFHCWNRITTADYVDVWPYHVHNSCEIVLVLQGSTNLVVRDQEYLLEENHIAIIPPLEAHAFNHKKMPYARIGMNIDCGALGSFGIPMAHAAVLSKRNSKGVHIIDTTSCPMLAKVISDIYEEYSQNSSMKMEMIAVLLHQFLLNFYRFDPKCFSDTSADAQMESVRLQIESSVQNCPSVKEMAKACFLTESHFIVRFKKHTGYTPCQYRILCQVSVARQLLTEKSLSLQEISDRCGFADLNSFVRRFRQVTKTTPGKFRNLDPGAAVLKRGNL